jgi:hypothetical protein
VRRLTVHLVKAKPAMWEGLIVLPPVGKEVEREREWKEDGRERWRELDATSLVCLALMLRSGSETEAEKLVPEMHRRKEEEAFEIMLYVTNHHLAIDSPQPATNRAAVSTRIAFTATPTSFTPRLILSQPPNSSQRSSLPLLSAQLAPSPLLILAPHPLRHQRPAQPHQPHLPLDPPVALAHPISSASLLFAGIPALLSKPKPKRLLLLLSSRPRKRLRKPLRRSTSPSPSSTAPLPPIPINPPHIHRSSLQPHTPTLPRPSRRTQTPQDRARQSRRTIQPPSPVDSSKALGSFCSSRLRLGKGRRKTATLQRKVVARVEVGKEVVGSAGEAGCLAGSSVLSLWGLDGAGGRGGGLAVGARTRRFFLGGNSLRNRLR